MGSKAHESAKLMQARSSITLSMHHLNELDTPLSQPDELLTRGLMGEVVQGPVTPLTASVFGQAFEVGLQDVYVACGAQDDFTEAWRFVRQRDGHLFLSLSALYRLCEAVLWVRKESIDLSVVGEIVPETPTFSPAPWWVRAWNQLKLLRYLRRAPKRLEALRLLCRSFSLLQTDNPGVMMSRLDAGQEVLNQAYAAHSCISVQAEGLCAALLAVLSEGKLESVHQSEVASLLVGSPSVEGADVVEALTSMARTLRTSPLWLRRFEESDDAALYQQLMASKDRMGRMFRGFMAAHGHRCLREAELSECDWSQEPAQVLGLLRQLLKQPEKQLVDVQEQRERCVAQSLWAIGMRVRGWQWWSLLYLLPKARQALARREESKSLCIKLQQKLKRGYLHLGALLAAEGVLEEAADIFFLTREELRALVWHRESPYKEKILGRKQAFEAAKGLRFAEVYVGMPAPKREQESVCEREELSSGAWEWGSSWGSWVAKRQKSSSDQIR